MKYGEKKRWYDQLWVWTTVDSALVFNVLFARMGMVSFSHRCSLSCLAERTPYGAAAVAGTIYFADRSMSNIQINQKSSNIFDGQLG